MIMIKLCKITKYMKGIFLASFCVHINYNCCYFIDSACFITFVILPAKSIHGHKYGLSSQVFKIPFKYFSNTASFY
jgi:hypothetical protein